MKTASAKAKGRRLQNWVALHISNLLGLPWGKDEMIAPREMGQSGTDVRLVGPAKVAFPFAVECKYCEKWQIHQWIKQAKENQDKDTDWLLVMKRNHQRPVIALDAEVFFKLLERIDNGTE